MNALLFAAVLLQPSPDFAALAGVGDDFAAMTAPCPPGECRCPQSGAAGQPRKSEVEERPDLTVTTASKGCPPCDRFEREELPRLLRSGWKVDVRKVPFGSAVTPAFELRSGEKWVGYSNVADFEAKIGGSSKWATPPAVSPTKAVVEPSTVKVLQSVPPASRRWTYSGSDLAAHVRNVHGIDTTGMSYADLVNAHSHAHEGTWNSVRGGYVASAPARRYTRTAPRMSSGCPSGSCPSGGCPSGSCPSGRSGLFGLGWF